MINKAILIGNVGKDPEIRTLEGGVKVANFSLATSENWKDKQGEKHETTEWHNIVLWRGLAEVAEKWVHKGDTLYIEGKLTTRSWDDKDGNKRYITEIQGNEMRIISARNKALEEKTPSHPPESNVNFEEAGDPLPF